MAFETREIGRTGVRVTTFGLGGCPLGNLMGVVTNAQAQSIVAGAWEAGCRYYDTAPVYGFRLSERRLGHTLRELAAAALQFPLTHPAVVSVIPGISTAEQLAWNLERFTQAIPHGLWSDLKSQGLLRVDAPVPG